MPGSHREGSDEPRVAHFLMDLALKELHESVPVLFRLHLSALSTIFVHLATPFACILALLGRRDVARHCFLYSTSPRVLTSFVAALLSASFGEHPSKLLPGPGFISLNFHSKFHST